MTKLFNQPQQKNIRKVLRKQPITCERILWGRVRDSQLGDFKFKKQFGIDKYIVDFCCFEAKLVVELDGATHSTDKEIQYDVKRQKFLEEQGFLVKRYNNSDVKENLILVLEDIVATCRERVNILHL
ncbi:DUF559 domain-containing protein [Candidatus Parcubacteria bacterium]|nr:DUF559 domain-containing protein [Patescibacteria group bacterium]MBU4309404.1 DUF559 domain-containing protein [Patescibacteria group bacterium]MBU4431973.1 DUF559 domain-containing protein [Patescibacteria group bacterium]MBU4577765.1 DUF559 domain-containing protein [Patescibacteria group bacterium]MCG2697450.1 DUF559 domain-containing protein [Candidatus Parcubacteria bacterium]